MSEDECMSVRIVEAISERMGVKYSIRTTTRNDHFQGKTATYKEEFVTEFKFYVAQFWRHLQSATTGTFCKLIFLLGGTFSFRKHILEDIIFRSKKWPHVTLVLGHFWGTHYLVL